MNTNKTEDNEEFFPTSLSLKHQLEKTDPQLYAQGDASISESTQKAEQTTRNSNETEPAQVDGSGSIFDEWYHSTEPITNVDVERLPLASSTLQGDDFVDISNNSWPLQSDPCNQLEQPEHDRSYFVDFKDMSRQAMTEVLEDFVLNEILVPATETVRELSTCADDAAVTPRFLHGKLPEIDLPLNTEPSLLLYDEPEVVSTLSPHMVPNLGASSVLDFGTFCADNIKLNVGSYDNRGLDLEVCGAALLHAPISELTPISLEVDEVCNPPVSLEGGINCDTGLYENDVEVLSQVKMEMSEKCEDPEATFERYDDGPKIKLSENSRFDHILPVGAKGANTRFEQTDGEAILRRIATHQEYEDCQNSLRTDDFDSHLNSTSISDPTFASIELLGGSEIPELDFGQAQAVDIQRIKPDSYSTEEPLPTFELAPTGVDANSVEEMKGILSEFILNEILIPATDITWHMNPVLDDFISDTTLPYKQEETLSCNDQLHLREILEMSQGTPTCTTVPWSASDIMDPFHDKNQNEIFAEHSNRNTFCPPETMDILSSARTSDSNGSELEKFTGYVDALEDNLMSIIPNISTGLIGTDVLATPVFDIHDISGQDPRIPNSPSVNDHAKSIIPPTEEVSNFIDPSTEPNSTGFSVQTEVADTFEWSQISNKNALFQAMLIQNKSDDVGFNSDMKITEPGEPSPRQQISYPDLIVFDFDTNDTISKDVGSEKATDTFVQNVAQSSSVTSDPRDNHEHERTCQNLTEREFMDEKNTLQMKEATEKPHSPCTAEDEAVTKGSWNTDANGTIWTNNDQNENLQPKNDCDTDNLEKVNYGSGILPEFMQNEIFTPAFERSYIEDVTDTVIGANAPFHDFPTTIVRSPGFNPENSPIIHPTSFLDIILNESNDESNNEQEKTKVNLGVEAGRTEYESSYPKIETSWQTAGEGRKEDAFVLKDQGFRSTDLSDEPDLPPTSLQIQDPLTISKSTNDINILEEKVVNTDVVSDSHSINRKGLRKREDNCFKSGTTLESPEACGNVQRPGNVQKSDSLTEFVKASQSSSRKTGKSARVSWCDTGTNNETYEIEILTNFPNDPDLGMKYEQIFRDSNDNDMFISDAKPTTKIEPLRTGSIFEDDTSPIRVYRYEHKQKLTPKPKRQHRLQNASNISIEQIQPPQFATKDQIPIEVKSGSGVIARIRSWLYSLTSLFRRK